MRYPGLNAYHTKLFGELTRFRLHGKCVSEIIQLEVVTICAEGQFLNKLYDHLNVMGAPDRWQNRSLIRKTEISNDQKPKLKN